MTNTLAERPDNLALMTHSELLGALSAAVEQEDHLFRIVRRPGRDGVPRDFLYLTPDEVAARLARAQADWLPDPVHTRGRDPTSVTLSMTHEQEVGLEKGVRALLGRLEGALQAAAAGAGVDLDAYVRSACMTPAELTVPERTLRTIGFSYEFDRQVELARQRLREHGPGVTGPPLLREHRCSITVARPADFLEDFRAGLLRALEGRLGGLSLDERADLERVFDEQAQMPGSALRRACALLSGETVGQLKKQAQLCYQEWIAEQLEDGPARTALQTQVARLRALDQMLHDPARDEEQDTVYLGGESYNLADLFAPSVAYDPLPVYPVIPEGVINEMVTPEGDEQRYVFALKWKLDGEVARYNEKSSWDYHTRLLLRPEGVPHKKLLHFFVLYFVLFVRYGEPDCDVVLTLRRDLLPRLRQGTDEQKLAAMRSWAERLRRSPVHDQLRSELVPALRACLGHLRAAEEGSWPVHIGLLPGVLEGDRTALFRHDRFFRPGLLEDEKSKRALAYVAVTPAHLSTALCKMQATITLEDIRYCDVPRERQTFAMRYALEGRLIFPVLLTPNTERTREYLGHNFAQMRGAIVQYNHAEALRLGGPRQWFVYRYVYSLLTYLCLAVIARHAPPQTFYPLLRLHLQRPDDSERQDAEDFSKGLSRVLAHVLSEDYLANSQGFVIGEHSKNYRVTNALSSLYSALPKAFRCTGPSRRPALERLALVVVSSRECDGVRGGGPRRAVLYGEAVSIARLGPDVVHVERLKAFSGIYDSEEMYTAPRIVDDEVHKLYRAGYRHVLYLARAPYSSSLRLIQEELPEGLYFLSPPAIAYIKDGKPDLRLYPIFYTEYFAAKVRSTPLDSFYIQDVREHGPLLDDHRKRVADFLKISGGKAIRNVDQGYERVVSYATLLSMHQGILENKDIMEGLLSDGPLRDDILFYLTLFHFSRYQKYGANIALKLAPYDHLIGDRSVGALAVRAHFNKNQTFNFLAFLSQVRKIAAAGGTAAGRKAS